MEEKAANLAAAIANADCTPDFAPLSAATDQNLNDFTFNHLLFDKNGLWLFNFEYSTALGEPVTTRYSCVKED